jgi:hypothetical protein
MFYIGDLVPISASVSKNLLGSKTLLADNLELLPSFPVFQRTILKIKLCSRCKNESGLL